MNTQLIKREIKKPNGEVYAEVWREGGQLRLVLSQYSPGIQIRMDEKAIPQLIEALKSIADPERQEPFGFVALNEVTEQFNSVNCGTIYRLPAEGRLPLYTHSQLKQEQGEPVAFIDERGNLQYYKPTDFNQCEYGGLQRLYAKE